MRVVIFCHSLISDWNHGNTHFLRGITSELLARGHDARVYEPVDAWSLQHLIAEQGARAIEQFHASCPQLKGTRYDVQTINLDAALAGAGLVLVHEWNPPELVARIGRHRAHCGDYLLLFHDTHHRAVSRRAEIARYDLSNYDGVLAFGTAIRDLYLAEGWTGRAFTWHEAADTRVFRPIPGRPKQWDLVWVGNWGDEERTIELREFLIEPVKTLGLRAIVHGVRYPPEALEALQEAGIDYGGWLPNYEVPELFAQARITVHIPRRPYTQKLPGIPTIRIFEALACGIPLISAPWRDTEGLFTVGEDFLIAQDGEEMTRRLTSLLTNEDQGQALAAHGRQTILDRHTCAHRIDQLLAICEMLSASTQPAHV